MKAGAAGLCIALAAVGGCAKAEKAPPAPPLETPLVAPTPTPSPTPAASSAKPSREAEEACVDQWLATRGLDRYGGQAGTMYAGGTPLFDERTGERRDRLRYVYAQHPTARETCGK